MENIIEQVTDVEQSEELVELGFSKSTASLRWILMSRVYEEIGDVLSTKEGGEIETIPCWTISDMMKIAQNCDDVWFEESEAYHNVSVVIEGEFVSLVDNEDGDNDDIEFCRMDSLRNNLFDCLIWLKTNKYL